MMNPQEIASVLKKSKPKVFWVSNETEDAIYRNAVSEFNKLCINMANAIEVKIKFFDRAKFLAECGYE